MNNQSQGYNQHNIQCIQQQNKIATIIRDHAYKVNLLETLNKNISNNSQELEHVQNQIRELFESSTDFDTQLISLYAEKDSMEQSVALVEADYFKARGSIDELETRIRQVRHQREQSEQIGLAIKDKTMELKMQLNSLKERLSVEFNLDLNDALKRTFT